MADQFGMGDAIVNQNATEDFGANDEIDQHNPLRRGWNKMTQSVGLTSDLATGDYKGAASRLADIGDYQRKNPGTPEGKKLMDAWNKGDGISGGISEVGGAIAKDWDESKGAMSKLRSVGRNVSAMGQGVLEQTPNMVPPMAGMLAGGAAGSAAMPVIGTALGGWAGASLGNTAVEGGGMAQEAMQKAGVNTQDKSATEEYLRKNGDTLMTQAGVKGAIIGAVDTLTAGLGHHLLAGPAKAAAGRAATAMGIDVADKAAMKAASGEIGARMAADPVYKAATSGAQNVARNVGTASLEPAGEFTGEYVGQGVATGDWDKKNAFLEAASSVGQGAATFAGQKAFASMSSPFGSGDKVAPVDAALPVEQPDAPQGPTPALGYSPLAGTPIVFPDGSVSLNGEQAFDKRYAPQPAKPSEVMGITPEAGPLSRVAADAVDNGVHADIQQAQAVDEDQAAYEAHMAQQEAEAQQQDTANQPITQGPLAEAQMSDEDKRAVLFSNQAVADGGMRYEGTQDGDILNGMGAPFATRMAAARRAKMEGAGWTIAPVFDGFVARRKDAFKEPNGTTDGIQPVSTASGGNDGPVTQASMGLGATDGNGVGADTAGSKPSGVGRVGEQSGGVAASPVAKGRAQPTTLGTQTSVKAGPGFSAKDVPSVKNPAPAAIGTQAQATPDQAPQAVAGNAATAGKLPGAGSATVQANGVKVPDRTAPFMRPEDQMRASIDSAAQELAMQVHNESEQDDFNAEEVPQAIAQWAKDSNIPADDLRNAFKAEIETRNFAKKSAVLQAINPIPQDASAANRAKLKAKNTPTVKDSLTVQEPSRSKSGYAEVKLDGKKHFVTPFDDRFVIRDATGNTVRDESRKNLEFATEAAAIQYASENATRKQPVSQPQEQTSAKAPKAIETKAKPETGAAASIPEPAAGTGVEGAGEGVSNKAKWIKAVADKNRLNGSTGVQLTVTSNGKLSFLGDPNSSKDGRALQANLNEALKAGATVAEIAEALKQKPAPKPAAKPSRQYHLVAVNEKTGEKTTLTRTPVSHSEAVTMKGKYDDKPGRRIQLEDVTPTESASNPLETKPAERTATEHAGVKIYPITFKGESRWAVQSENNRSTGLNKSDNVLGDTIHATLDEAKQEAERQVVRVKSQQERSAAHEAEAAAAQAKKDANKGKSIVERKRDADLDKPTRLHPNAGLGTGTRRESMQKAVDQDRYIEAATVRDEAAKKRDTDLVERSHRANLPTGNINYPGVKEYFEAQARLKANKYEKPEYRVYMGRDGSDSFYEITKTEYDYAQELKAEPKDLRENYIKSAADSIGRLRKSDVDRVLNGLAKDNIDGVTRADLAAYIKEKHPDYTQEVDDVLAEIATATQAPADITPVATESVAKADAKAVLSEKEKAAKAKMFNALGKLAHLAGKNTRMNWTQEEEQQLLPIVIELFDGAMDLGAVKFKQAVAYVREFISTNLDQETADAIPFDTLQGAYISVAGRHKDKGVTSKKEVVSFESLAELENSEDKAEKAPVEVVDEYDENNLDESEGRDGWKSLTYVYGDDDVSYPVDFRDIRTSKEGSQKVVRQIRIYDPNRGSYMAVWEWRSAKLTDDALARLSVDQAVFHYSLSDNTEAAFGKDADNGDALWSKYWREITNAVADEKAKPENKQDQPLLNKPTATPSLANSEGRHAVAQSVADHLIGGGKFDTIIQARKFISELTGEKIEAATDAAKRADEAIELGVVIASRDIVQAARKQGRSDQVIFDRLMGIYEAQPSLNVRDSVSLRNQAYSTPVPLAFLASRLARVTPQKLAGEPTAGNGALMMEADPKTSTVNEIQDDRLEALKSQGFNPTQNDAAAMRFKPQSLDSMVMNPPFGAVNGQKWTFGDFTTGEIDHAIVLNSLEALKDNGDAVLIIGGMLAREDGARKDGYRGKAKREFFFKLYSQYNVVDHFTVSGDLYKKQGAAYPVDVIVIKGRGKSARGLPAAELPKLIDTWEQVKEKLNESESVGTQGTGNTRGDTSDSNTNTQPGQLPGDSGGSPAISGGSQPGGRSPSIGNSGGRGTSSGSTGGRKPTKQGGKSDSLGQRGNDLTSSQDGGTGNTSTQGSNQQQGSAGSIGSNKPADVGNGSSGQSDTQGIKDAAESGKLQVKYQNFSDNNSVNTLVATNHLSAIEGAFKALENRVGNIDEFVRAELQYEPEAFKKAFSAEQVEALALAIDNINQGKGFIIGDQTGIGKGRVVAAMIRYAKLNGKTPVFVTQMPDLYGDMMRDLNDIGMTNTKPLMTNNGASVPLDSAALDWFSEKQGAETRITELQDAIESVAVADLGANLSQLAPDERARALANEMKASTNPELISLREEIDDLKESLKELRANRRGKFLDTPDIKTHETMLEQMVNAGSIGDYDVIFTTYNQMAALDSGKPKKDANGRKTPARPATFGYRNTFLKSFINDKSMLILDESHNAGARGEDIRFPKVGDVVRQFVQSSGGVFYSSATFAKNTEVMDVYSKTDLGSAFARPVDLVNAVNSVPMQQITSAMLVEAGQYLRRERSFDGITYETAPVEVDQQAAEDLANAMRLVVAFDAAKIQALNDIQNELDAEGAAISTINGGGSSASVDSTNFTSVMHNVVGTFLLALKADATANLAVNAIRNGEKPIITVANTMEMFITEYAKDAGIGIGDKLDATFSDVMKRYLDKTRKAKIKHANGDTEVVQLTDAQLGPDGVDAYNAAYEFIDEMGMDIPLSPIDHIKQKIEEAGFSIGEITGRQTVVEGGIIKGRNKAEMKTAGKKNTIAKYNGGGLDALIINRSGSTGLSMHASATFADQRRRVMIIAQAELDINNHMQMLGRINRTGQVTTGPFDAGMNGTYQGRAAQYGLPRYAQMTANVPIELRPAAVLSNKMAGLNANTTAGRKSAVEDKTALDFMNKYGDRVAAELVGGDYAVNSQLGFPIRFDDQGNVFIPGSMGRVTGRIGLLPLKTQTELYSQLATGYADLISQLDALGQNDLEAKTYPVDAETIERKVVQKADKDSSGPFTAAVVAEKVSMKKLGKPYPKAKVQELVAQALNGVEAMEARRRILVDTTYQINEEVKALQDSMAAADADSRAGIQKRVDALNAASAKLRQSLPAIGLEVMLKTDSGDLYGVVTGIDKTGKAKSAGSLSAWKIRIAVVDGARSMTLPLTQIVTDESAPVPENSIVMKRATEMTLPNAERNGFDTVPILEAFDRGQSDSRETRVIITGNILRGYAGLRGRLLNYTDNKGGIRQGILMPPDFDMESASARFTPALTTPDEVISLLDNGGVVIDKSNSGETLRFKKTNGSYLIEVSKTGTGKRLAKNAGSLNFVSSGNKMRVRVWESAEVKAFIKDVAFKDGISLIPDSDSVKLLDGDDAPATFSRPRFSRDAQSQANESVERLARGIASHWENPPKVVIAFDMDDPLIPESVRKEDQRQRSGGATGTPEGFYYKGTVYLMSSKLGTPNDIARVLFHESLGHYGLRGTFGKALRPILRDVAMMRKAEVDAKITQYGLKIGSQLDRFTAAEEVLAEMAQAKPEIGFVQRAIAAIRTWLRQNVPGFNNLRLSDAELIRNYILPARAWVERGGDGGPKGGFPVMSRGTSTDQTDTAAFRNWFGDSKVVDSQGKPLVVYHGTGADFSEFDGYKIGDNTDHPSARLGFYFSDAAAASDFVEYTNGQTEGQLVMPVYLAISNPFKMTYGDFKRKFITPQQMGSASNWDLSDKAEDLRRRLEDEGYDGILVKKGRKSDGSIEGDSDQWIAFNPEQIKSATGNSGAFDGQNPDIRFSRSIGDTLTSATNSVRDVALPAGYKVNDLIASVPGKLNWWHKTVGTQYNLAQRSPAFKRVFDSVQNFINDVSYFATEAADLAPTILPKLESWKDIARAAMKPEDAKALSRPVFEGTLLWGRDSAGKPVKMEVLEAEAAKVSTDEKAQILIRKNLVSNQVMTMWRGMQLDQYNALIEGKYEREMLRPGVVWKDSELQSMFGLNEKQIPLYKEFRAATNKSLTNLAITDMLRYAGKDAAPIRDVVQGSKTAMEAAETLRDYLLSLTDDDSARSTILINTANTIIDKGTRAQDLIDRGYAPLSRFGQHTLDVVDADGERVYFGMFESTMDAAKMARDMTALHPGATVKRGTVSQEEYKLFAGVSPETLELFGDMLGLEAKGDDAASKAFQTYIKLSKNNRSSMKRLLTRKGIAGFSEDAGRVLAGFVYSNARQSSKNLHMGEMTEAASVVGQNPDGSKNGEGELKDAAVQLVDYIQNPMEEAQAIRGLMFAQYIGGSVASAMVNLTQPITMTFPWLSQYGGGVNAAKQMTAAMRDALKAHTGDTKLDAAIRRAEEDGTVSPQEVHQLMQQSQGKGALRSGDGTRAGNALATAQNGVARVGLAWGKLFGAAEQFNRRVTFIAAYRTAVAQGIANPDAFARKAIAETQGVYSKGNKPAWARGAVGGTLFTFKQYSIAYVEMLSRMAKAGAPGSPERAQGQKAALLALAVLFLLSGAGGMPGADDLDDVISGAMQSLGYNFDSKMKRKEFFVGLLGEGGAQFVERGVSGLPGVPIDVSGRMGLGNLIPGTGLFTKKTDHTRDVTELLGPVGDLAKRGFEAAGQMVRGDVQAAVNTVSPVAVRNLTKAYDMASMGMYRDQSGKKVIDTGAGDAIAKAIGFQPSDVKRVQDASQEAVRMIGLNKMRESEIADEWAKGLFERDTAKVQAARADISAWNRDNPESPISIKFSQVLSRVKQMNMTKEQRIAKTAPAEIRATVRKELAAR